MTVEEAEKILGIERNMSYEEVLRVRSPLSCLPLLGVVAVVFEKLPGAVFSILQLYHSVAHIT